MEAEKAQKEAWETFLCHKEMDIRLSVDDWVERCRKIRFVELDSLSAEFNVSMEHVVARIEKLVEEQRVAGVFVDNRRTFVVFGEKELQSLADVVRTKGCVDAGQVADWMNKQVEQHVTPLY